MGLRFSPDHLEHPIVQAPMGGGPSTPALAAAVSGAGGLGFLAAGYKPVDGVRADIEAVRAQTDRPFGVNLFAPPSAAAPDPAALERYADALGAEAERYGVALGEPRHDDDGWDAKLALLADAGVAVVAFTFGCPAAGVVADLQRAGAAVWVTVTTPAEARIAVEAGADALVVQGFEAGGHRASFDDAAPGQIGLLALLQLVAAAVETPRGETGGMETGGAVETPRGETAGMETGGAVETPMIATGGIATGRAVAAVLAAGASAAQLGTAFMLCPEAGTSPAHRTAIAQDAETALTRAFTGRTARGIVNRFLREHGAGAPSAYPDVHHLTAPVRGAARKQGDPDGFHLWAGQAHALAQPVPAADLVRGLANEARAALRASG